MSVELSSPRIKVDNFEDAVELYYEKGWTDGLPVIPPTEKKIVEFLEFSQLKPEQIIGEIPERNRAITAEKLAINAIMAGCKKEYMPVLVAAVEAVCDPLFKFNHMASLGGPWPVMIIGGPVVKDLGFNYGIWVLGPGWRPNATVGRALSLLLWNCAEARPGALQRGAFGTPYRWNSCCMAENPDDFGWVSLREYLGFKKTDSTVTLVPTLSGHNQAYNYKALPEAQLDAIADALATTNFNRGTYVVLVGTQTVEIFAKNGWSRKAVRDWLFANTRRSVADLKRKGRWGFSVTTFEGFAGEIQSILPGDESKFAYLFKQTELDKYIWAEGMQVRDAPIDIYLVICGGDVAPYSVIISPYSYSSNAVTKLIKWPASSKKK